MPRGKSNNNRGVQFTAESAREIAELVRTHRPTNRDAPSGGGRSHIYPSSHYVSQTTSAWSKGTSQTLTIYSGDPGSEAAVSGQTITAWNNVASIGSGVKVIVARGNGAFYLASFDFTALSGFDGTKQQVLAHNTSGQLVWLSTTDCT